MRRIPLGALVLLGFLSGAGAPLRALAPPPSPELGGLSLREYVASGTYLRNLAAVTGRAGTWIEERAARRAPDERLAVVFDIDETALSNLPNLGVVPRRSLPAAWQEAAAQGRLPTIEPVLEVYRRTRAAGVEVIFLSGRDRKTQQASTERSLRAAGFSDFTLLICEPGDGTYPTTGAFKTAERKRLVAEGWTLIADIGDQASDFAGDTFERGFKLPNPFYTVP